MALRQRCSQCWFGFQAELQSPCNLQCSESVLAAVVSWCAQPIAECTAEDVRLGEGWGHSEEGGRGGKSPLLCGRGARGTVGWELGPGAPRHGSLASLPGGMGPIYYI